MSEHMPALDVDGILQANRRADMAAEDRDLELLRVAFGAWYSITVCDRIWEARPREKMREDAAITSMSATGLAWQLLKDMQRNGLSFRI